MLTLLEKGGPIMWPLLLCSIFSLTVIIERAFFWLQQYRNKDNKMINDIFSLTEEGKFEEAIEKAEGTTCLTSKVLISGLAHQNYGLSECLVSAAESEIEKARRGLSFLDTIITLAPLLGILGTVSGIIISFDLIGASGIEDPTAVTGGIAQALITTAAGLSVAIVTLLPYNLFVRKVEKLTHYLERMGTHYEINVQKGMEKRCDSALDMKTKEHELKCFR